MQSRPLNLFDATMLVMGGIIGVGIFFTPHRVAAAAHEPAIFLALWLAGGLVALAGALTFAELGASLPREGGWYVFLREAFGPFPAFLFAWIVLGVVSTGAIAVVMSFCTATLAGLVPAIGAPDGPAAHVIGVIAILVVTGLAIGGVKLAAVFQNACMIVKLAAITAMIAGGWLVFGPDVAPARVDRAVAADGGGWIPGLLPVLFAFGGWQLLCYVATNVKDPQKTLPRAIVLGVAGVAATYLLVNGAYLHVLGIDALATDPQFASEMARRTMGSRGAEILQSALVVSALGWCVATIFTTPWLYVAMAREGLFFSRFAQLNARTGAPTLALLLQAAVAIAYFSWGRIGPLTDAVVYVEWIFHALVAIALLRLRSTRPDLPRPFKSPLYPLAPIAYLAVATVVVLGTVMQSNRAVITTGLVAIGLGTIAYKPWKSLVARQNARSAKTITP